MLRLSDELSSPTSQILDINSNSRATCKSLHTKRAAQNRAAQKAFRQRRDQYIKDLEQKSKELEDWQQEVIMLRMQNKELLDEVSALRKELAVFKGGKESSMPILSTMTENTGHKMSPSSISSTDEIISAHSYPQPARHKVEYTPNENTHPSTNDSMKDTHYDHHKTVSQNTNASYSAYSHNMISQPSNDICTHPQYNDDIQFDIHCMNDGFLSDGSDGQVLDDLFAVLKRRQRPRISKLTLDKNNQPQP
ncbi:hypothetical protein BDB01DRAFT_776411 [Pilobolus umbonatus]|nr:hypothetical protein BDB01DRAFT_776411 [Pilobolus umbonatus]